MNLIKEEEYTDWITEICYLLPEAMFLRDMRDEFWEAAFEMSWTPEKTAKVAVRVYCIQQSKPKNCRCSLCINKPKEPGN